MYRIAVGQVQTADPNGVPLADNGRLDPARLFIIVIPRKAARDILDRWQARKDAQS